MAEPYTRNGLAIINPYGGIWTDELFQTPEDALKYLRNYWGDRDLSEYRLAYASLEIKLYNGHGETIFVPLPGEVS